MADDVAEPLDKSELVEILDVGDAPRPRSDTLERPRINGSLPKEYFAAYGRDLVPADLEALKLPRGQAPRSLARIRASHHALARCLATGMRPMQAALVTGYSPDSISALSRDQTFQALVEDYRAETKSVFADLAERMNNMSLDAMELLQERLQDNPETFTVPVLLEIVKTFADRTGHGPGQDVNLKMSLDLIDRPPRESFEEWKARRDKELAPAEPKLLN